MVMSVFCFLGPLLPLSPPDTDSITSTSLIAASYLATTLPTFSFCRTVMKIQGRAFVRADEERHPMQMEGSRVHRW